MDAASSPSAPRENQPTRWQALLFSAKALVFRLRRALRDPLGSRPRKLTKAAPAKDTAVIAESTSALYSTSLPAEFALQAGKIHNVRLVAAMLDGLRIPAGQVFSFWANSRSTSESYTTYS